MSQSAQQTCPVCSRPVPSTSRFCPHCGTSMTQKEEPEEVVITGSNRLHITHDALDLRDLQAIIESSVAWWQQKLHTEVEVGRERAAASIKELSRILDSLSQQLAQGRETMRITTRLPTVRMYRVGCPVCGRGNREGARFCQSCGSLLPDPHSKSVEQPARAVLQITTAARSDTGRVRHHNEDTCMSDTLHLPDNMPMTLLLVADGMGGMQAGEEASYLAAETTRQVLNIRLTTQTPASDDDWHALLHQAVSEANEQVYARSGSDDSQMGMGTTLTLLLIVGARAHVAHVGDSRAYLFNADGVTDDETTLMRLTSDHSLVARLVDIGQITAEQARLHPQRNMLYRALGTHASVEIDTSSYPLGVGDRLLLCSDGLLAHLEDDELADMVLEGTDASQICNSLIARANERGGRDNISVVLAMVEGIDHHVPL